jgi:predicted transcriptional regulator of viral defense system
MMYFLSSMTKPDTLAIETFRAHGGVLRTKEALDLGIHPRTLYQLRDDGVIEPVSRGVYRLAELGELSHPDLVTVALRVPRAVVCLISALAVHDATTQIPHEVQIAVPRGTKTPQLEHPPLRVFRFSGPALTEGIEVVEVDAVQVRIYDLAKTVVDCFRFRNKIGIDIAIEALGLAVKRRRVAPADILRYARRCRAERVMLPHLQALG